MVLSLVVTGDASQPANTLISMLKGGENAGDRDHDGQLDKRERARAPVSATVTHIPLSSAIFS